MAQVIVPQKNKNQGLGDLMTIGGAIAGGVLTAGNPAGAVAGASLGAGLGGAAGNLMSQNSPAASNPGIPSQGMAMQRRAQQLGTDNLATLKQAEMQLPSLPENLRQQYTPAIVQARMLEQQKRGLV